MEEQLTLIGQLVEAYPEGIGMGDLKQECCSAGLGISTRSLLRRLDLLIEDDRICARGIGRGRIYLPAVPDPDGSTDAEDFPFSLSEASREIRRYVRQPVQMRTPVDYLDDF